MFELLEGGEATIGWAPRKVWTPHFGTDKDDIVSDMEIHEFEGEDGIGYSIWADDGHFYHEFKTLEEAMTFGSQWIKDHVL